MVNSYTPLQLMMGKSVTYPWISQCNESTVSVFGDEGVMRAKLLSALGPTIDHMVARPLGIVPDKITPTSYL